MNYLKLTDFKLDINEISELVAHESCGAVSLFVGTTRDNFEGKTVIKLEYESYDEMAKKTMLNICNNIRELWPDVKNIAIFHRLGLVPVKEASVVIAISSPHRRESLDAVNYTIEQLKKSVPIFKKEIYKDPENLTSQSDSNSEPSRKKIKPLNFEDCKVVDYVNVPKNLVQINVDESEIEKRIKNFIERKRDEIDKNNIKEFLAKPDNTDESSCARVNSMIVRSVDSKGHVKARRVKNEYGPQDDINYKNTLNNFMDRDETPNLSVSKQEIPIQSSIAERLENAENFLNIQDCKKSIFERIKLIEDRILYLESISPEYSHFVDKHKNVVSSLPSISRSSNSKKSSSYTPQILDQLIKDIELKMENK